MKTQLHSPVVKIHKAQGRTLHRRHRVCLWAVLGCATLAFQVFSGHAATQLQFEASSTQISEATVAASVAVVRSGSLEGTVSVAYSSQDDTALAGRDYLVASGTLTFNSGEGYRLVPLRLIHDGLKESTKRFILTLSNPSGGAELGARKTTLINIVDDDLGISFSSAEFAVVEGSLGPAIITVVRGVDDLSAGLTVDYATSDGTAIAGADYTGVAGTLTFRPGDTQETFEIPILNDRIQEGIESIKLTLSNPAGGGFLASRTNAILKIYDNDPGFSLSQAVYEVNEAAGVASITVVRGSDLGEAVSVEYATSDGTAMAGEDYTRTSGTLNFAADESTKTISIPILDDGLVEPRETFQLVLSHPSLGASLASQTSRATIGIASDDTGLQFSLSSYAVLENAGEAQVTVNRGKDTSALVSVEFTTVDDSARAGVDYVASSGVVRFAASERTQSIRVPILNNDRLDGNRSIQLQLSNPNGGASLGTRSRASLTIQDDESGVQLSQTSYPVSEAAGSVAVVVVRGDDGNMPVRVDYVTADGTAIAGVDYQTSSGSLTFAAGEASKTIAIQILNNAIADGNRTFSVWLTNVVSTIAGGPKQSARVVITDNDRGLAFSQSNYQVFETDTAAEITVVRADDGKGPVSVDYITSVPAGSVPATFVPQSGTLTFGASERAKSISIPLVNDSLANGDRVIQLTLRNPVGGVSLGFPASATLTILDDEQPVLLDTSFDVGSGVDGSVICLGVLPDGRIIVGGSFRLINGVSRDYLARLMPDGSVDPSFQPGKKTGGVDQPILCLAMQPDGSILIGGFFSSVDGISRSRLARLKPDGSLDSAFAPGEIDGYVQTMALQKDGKLVIGGTFKRVDGRARSNLARMNSDGSLDAEFLPPTMDGDVRVLVLQADGKILVAGSFQRISGAVRRALVRLNANGTLDDSYQPDVGGIVSSGVAVSGLALDASGKAIIAGNFTNVSNVIRLGLARIGSDGSPDLTFEPRQPSNQDLGKTRHVLIQFNGQILLSGSAVDSQGATRGGIARLNPDGTLDERFKAGFGWGFGIEAMALQTDGKVIIGGNFATVNGIAALNIARLLSAPSSGQVVQFSMPSALLIEGEGSIQLLLERFGGSLGDIAVDFTTNGGTATPGADYLIQQGTVHFRSGERTNAISISVLDDGVVELTESIVVTLSNPSAGVQLAPQRSVVIEIKDNEVPNALDRSFDASDVSGIATSAPLPNGQVIVAGCSLTVGGTPRGPVIRLNHDGGYDHSFKPPFDPGTDTCVRRLLIEPDGKILIAGEFYISAPGGDRDRLARLNADGSLDAGFLAAPEIASCCNQTLVSGVNGAILISFDGNVLRLKSDGSLDQVLLPSVQVRVRDWTQTFAVQNDGKVLVAGTFFVDGPPEGPFRFIRINGDGSLDPRFSENAKAVSTWDNVQSILELRDGKILVGGGIANTGGPGHAAISRLNADGTLDTAFKTPLTLESWGAAGSITVQNDGKILVGGIGHAARLEPDGAIDPTFVPDDFVAGWWDYRPHILVQDSTGGILMTGYSPNESGPTFNYLRRFKSDSRSSGVGFQAPRFVASESQGTVEISIRRVGDISLPISVEYEVLDGSALAGVDFVATAGSVSFAAMEAVKTFRIPLLDDGIDEPDKTAQLTLKNPSANSSLALAKAVLRIVDDERPGSVDSTFRPRFTADATGNFGLIDRAAVQEDGKILILGVFTLMDGQPRTLARLFPDGSLDASFAPIQNGYADTLLVQPDGKILTRSADNLVRLLADGSLDPTFSVAPGVASSLTGAALGLDGSIFIFGSWYGDGSNPFYSVRIIRLQPDGTVDPAFTAPGNAYGTVSGLVAQQDGSVVIWGSWGASGNNSATWRPKLMRLYPWGSQDPSFRPSIPSNGWNVRRLVLDSDDTLLVGGQIWINNSTVKPIVRLFPDGSIDPSFNADHLGDGSNLNLMAVQMDGNILVGGTGGSGYTVSIPSLVRLHPDGTLDSNFNAGIGPAYAQQDVGRLVPLPDGKVLMTGGLSSINEIVLPMMARLNGDFELRITDLRMSNSGQVRLTSTSRKGRSYLLQASQDLSRWTTLRTYAASKSALEMEDAPLAEGHLYYRVVQRD